MAQFNEKLKKNILFNSSFHSLMLNKRNLILKTTRRKQVGQEKETETDRQRNI